MQAKQQRLYELAFAQLSPGILNDLARAVGFEERGIYILNVGK